MSFSQPRDESEVTRVHLTQIGRYEVRDMLGSGGFGDVYLAFDEKLKRQVAIKVPHEGRITGKNDSLEYLEEARMVAQLDHPSIVPVYDVGGSEETEFYIVSKYIPGSDLRRLLKKKRFGYLESVRLVEAVARALHHAHKCGLVHRDVKPGNILIDEDGAPYVADFGLALSERRLDKGPRFAGTPSYMSPEQARGEGHRVDGRSDIFSLGAVLYELITGQRAFQGDTKSDLLEQIEHFDLPALRQRNEKLPKELDRICQKALAKQASERYWTAHDMAEDLGAFLRQDELQGTRESTAVGESTIEPSKSRDGSQDFVLRQDSAENSATNESDRLTETQTTVVLPKGLRSFDAHDADFFLELLPGPRDRNGLPDSLRFWKKRIESRDADESFSVGMIYGPSGCGKSSFVKAGLIPRLSTEIMPVFVETTGEFTEGRLLDLLRKSCPNLDADLGLTETIAALRRGHGLPNNRKILLVFDQFERWLHARQGKSARELVRALRQCDGERIQAILMVRSDFWMSVTRLLNELEIDLVQGINFAAVDLFPPRHARKVLASFGRAFGALPPDGRLEPEQQDFIHQSVEGLEQDGKLICVRLALYAEMIKNKPWKLSTLNELGGEEGVGVSFLDDSFGPRANPKIRLHQSAARSVLKSLLPDSGTQINIQMQPYDKLFEASGYKDKRAFDELIDVLDVEMRLISPTDPSGVSENEIDAPSDSPLDPHQKYFRLSHDYLVTSLRKWLSRKQRETRRGRAEILLAERASFWRAKQENRYLPSFIEHLQIRSLTSLNQWNQSEQAVMKRAAKAHGIWLGGVLAALTFLLVGGLWLRNSIIEDDVSQKVDSLLHADTSRVASSVNNLANYRSQADGELLEAFNEKRIGSPEKLHAAMAMVSESSKCRDYLFEQLPSVRVDRFQPVCDSLRNLDGALPDKYITEFARMLTDTSALPQIRLQAACAIAQLDGTNEIWQDSGICHFVADQLTRAFPSELAPIRSALVPVASSITPALKEIFADKDLEPQQRLFATESLVAFDSGTPQNLFDLLLDCDERQFPLVFRALATESDFVIENAKKIVARKSPSAELSDDEKVRFFDNQANAAVALYQLGVPEKVWPVLDVIDKVPVLPNLIIHRLRRYGSKPDLILEKLKSAKSTNTIRALMFMVGEYSLDPLDQERVDVVIEQAKEILRNSKTAKLKSAAQWILRTLDQSEYVRSVELKAMKQAQDLRRQRIARIDSVTGSNTGGELEEKLDEIASLQLSGILESDEDWYHTGEGHLMIRLDAGTIQMGDGEEREKIAFYEHLQPRKVDRLFALASTEVTVQQWSEFLGESKLSLKSQSKFEKHLKFAPNRPIVNVSWLEAVHYCNWLSEREGIPETQWCYTPHPEKGYDIGMQTKPEFWKLSGYRLPTEAEWEFACRGGGSITSRHYGNSVDLLDKYAWYQKNSFDQKNDGSLAPQPVGLLKPNALGFFDMHGNAMEWCFDLNKSLERFTPNSPDFPEGFGAVTAELRSLRGGAYYDLPIFVRSSNRYSQPPNFHLGSTGFRVARTLKNKSLAPVAETTE